MVVVLLYNSLTYSVLRIFVQKSDINVRCEPFISLSTECLRYKTVHFRISTLSG